MSLCIELQIIHIHQFIPDKTTNKWMLVNHIDSKISRTDIVDHCSQLIKFTEVQLLKEPEKRDALKHDQRVIIVSNCLHNVIIGIIIYKYNINNA